MPYYVYKEKEYAIWFDRSGDWFIGSLFWGFRLEQLKNPFQNNEFIYCPTDINDWREKIDSEWNSNLNAKLSCDNDTN